MRPVPTVSHRQYATASAHETPSNARSVADRFCSHPSGGEWCVSSTNSVYSPTVTGLRAMAKTFTCSVRGGSPSNASPAGTTTTSGSITARTVLTRVGGYARGSTRSVDASHPCDGCCPVGAVRTYAHELPRARSHLERKAHRVTAAADNGDRAGQRRDARRVQHPRRHRERLLRHHRERGEALTR